MLGNDVDSLRARGNGIAVVTGGRTIEVSHVLLASGRVPNVEELEPDRDRRAHATAAAIEVDDRQRTNVDGIWAAGDVAGRPQLTPIAQYQARIAVEDMFGDGARGRLLRPPDCDLHRPGARRRRPDRARGARAGHDVATATHPLANVTRAQYTRTKHGLYKIVFDPDDAPGARHPRRLPRRRATSSGASRRTEARRDRRRPRVMHHVYPSYSEGLKAAAEKALVSEPGVPKN